MLHEQVVIFSAELVAITRNAASPVGYFGLGDDRTITMGSQIRL